MSGDVVSITLGAGSGHVSAVNVSAHDFTLDASQSTERAASHFFGNISVSGTTNISLGHDNSLQID